MLGKAACPHPHGDGCTCFPGCPFGCLSNTLTLELEGMESICSVLRLLRHFTQANSTAFLPGSNSLMEKEGSKFMSTCQLLMCTKCACTKKSRSHIVCTAWTHTQDPLLPGHGNPIILSTPGASGITRNAGSTSFPSQQQSRWPYPEELPVTAHKDAHIVPAVPPLC